MKGFEKFYDPCQYLSQTLRFIKKKISDHIIIETENVKSDDRGGRALDSSAQYRATCPGINDCVPLRECPQILIEATTRCYNSDRTLFCGVNQNYEPYICCPSYQSPSFGNDGSDHLNNQDKLSGQCGKSLIQSTFYKKLGAHPFVARIGFKSEFWGIGKPAGKLSENNFYSVVSFSSNWVMTIYYYLHFLLH